MDHLVTLQKSDEARFCFAHGAECRTQVQLRAAKDTASLTLTGYVRP
jgi:hypothetical protein